MYLSILRLVFSRGYWRNMFQADTWQMALFDVRRARKDERARKRLRRFLLMVFAPLLAPLCLLLMLTPGGALGTGIAELRRWNKKRKTPAAPAPDRLPPPAAGPDLRREVAELALLHAVLADRAGSERFLKTKVMPEGLEVATRRVLLDILRDRDMYMRLAPTERDLLLLPDGHWSDDDIHQATLTLETTRVLRWVLRVDHFLPMVGQCLVLDFKFATTSVANPEILFRGTDFIDYETLLSAIRTSDYTYHRCVAEEIHRGMVKPTSEEQAEWAKGVVAELAGKESQDTTLGSTIVSQADEWSVNRARFLAARRSVVLRWVMSRLYDDVPKKDDLEAFFLHPAVPSDPEDRLPDGEVTDDLGVGGVGVERPPESEIVGPGAGDAGEEQPR